MDDNIFWLRLWVSISVIVATIIMLALVFDYRFSNNCIDNGYTQVQNIGYSGSHWVKPAEVGK